MSSQDNSNNTTSATSNENFSFPRRSKTESLLSASVPTSGSPYASTDTAANSLEEERSMINVRIHLRIL